MTTSVGVIRHRLSERDKTHARVVCRGSRPPRVGAPGVTMKTSFANEFFWESWKRKRGALTTAMLKA
jgi:hypothetical protein